MQVPTFLQIIKDQTEDVWCKQALDAFLKFNKKDLLTNAGKVSAEVAKRLALSKDGDSQSSLQDERRRTN